jgi:hypothetical protein
MAGRDKDFVFLDALLDSRLLSIVRSSNAPR